MAEIFKSINTPEYEEQNPFSEYNSIWAIVRDGKEQRTFTSLKSLIDTSIYDETSALRLIFKNEHNQHTEYTVAQSNATNETRPWNIETDAIPPIEQVVAGTSAITQNRIYVYKTLVYSNHKSYFTYYGNREDAEKVLQNIEFTQERILNEKYDKLIEGKITELNQRSQAISFSILDTEIPEVNQTSIHIQKEVNEPVQTVTVFQYLDHSEGQFKVLVAKTESVAKTHRQNLVSEQNVTISNYLDTAKNEYLQQLFPEVHADALRLDNYPEIERIQYASHPLTNEPQYVFVALGLQDAEEPNDDRTFMRRCFNNEADAQEYRENGIKHIRSRDIVKLVQHTLTYENITFVRNLPLTITNNQAKETWIRWASYLREYSEFDAEDQEQFLAMQSQLAHFKETFAILEDYSNQARPLIDDFVKQVSPNGSMEYKQQYRSTEVYYEPDETYFNSPIACLFTEGGQILAVLRFQEKRTSDINDYTYLQTEIVEWDNPNVSPNENYWTGLTPIGTTKIEEFKNVFLTDQELYENYKVDVAFRTGEDSMRKYWIANSGNNKYALAKDLTQTVNIAQGVKFPIILTDDYLPNGAQVVRLCMEEVPDKYKINKNSNDDSTLQPENVPNTNQQQSVSLDMLEQLKAKMGKQKGNGKNKK